jgi:hypothetical protein
VLNGESAEFNHYIVRLAGVVDETTQTKKNASNSYLWDDYDATRDCTIVVRAGDHGVQLVVAATTRLGAVIEIKTTYLGTHPTEPGRPFHTLDWTGTADAAMRAGVPSSKRRLTTSTTTFTTPGTAVELSLRMQKPPVSTAQSMTVG